MLKPTPKYDARLYSLAQEHTAAEQALRTQLSGMSSKLNPLRKRLLSQATLHRKTATLLRTKRFDNMVDKTPANIMPEGFTVVAKSDGTSVTWAVYEGRAMIAEQLASRDDAIRLATAFAAAPKPAAQDEVMAPSRRVFTLKTPVMLLPPSFAQPVLNVVRELTEQVLRSLQSDVLSISGTDDGHGTMTFTGTCPASWTDGDILEEIQVAYAQRTEMGREISDDELNALTVFESVTMDPIAKNQMTSLIKRLLQY